MLLLRLLPPRVPALPGPSVLPPTLHRDETSPPVSGSADTGARDPVPAQAEAWFCVWNVAVVYTWPLAAPCAHSVPGTPASCCSSTHRALSLLGPQGALLSPVPACCTAAPRQPTFGPLCVAPGHRFANRTVHVCSCYTLSCERMGLPLLDLSPGPGVGGGLRKPQLRDLVRARVIHRSWCG